MYGNADTYRSLLLTWEGGIWGNIKPEGEVAAWLAFKAMGSNWNNGNGILFPSGKEKGIDRH